MEPDLKDTIKKLEEAKNRQERIERIIILLSGLLIIVIFSIIGINIYTDREETVSEPEVTIVSKEVKKTEIIPQQETVVLPQKSSPPPETPKKDQKTEKKTAQETPKIEKPETPKETANKKEKPVKKEKNRENVKISRAEKPVKKIEKPSFTHGFYIQVGAFSSKKKAEKLIGKIKLKNVYIRKEGELYKVLIGSFKNKKEAYSFMKEKNIKGFIRKL